MDKRIREKIALFVFAFLVVFAAVVLIGYFTTGRSWSVAASFVDDRVGRMDGYTVIGYAGVVDERSLGDSEDSENSGEDSATVDEGQGLRDDPSSSNASEAGDDAAGADTLGSTASSSTDEGAVGDSAESVMGSFESFRAAPSPVADAAAGESSESEDVGSSEASGAAISIGLDVLALYADMVPASSLGVFVSDIRQIYADKGAGTLTLDLYRVLEDGFPEIYEEGGKRIGVYGADVYTSKAWLGHYMKYFEENDADIVIGVTPRTGYLATYDGTDVVLVTTSDEGISTQGFFSSSTFVVRSPEKGDVGLVILTSNGTASSKVFDN